MLAGQSDGRHSSPEVPFPRSASLEGTVRLLGGEHISHVFYSYLHLIISYLYFEYIFTLTVFNYVSL